MSRYGRMRVSRIFCQMMRVISSPSISTTGVFTLILDIYSPAGTRTKLLLCSVQALTARFMRLLVQAFLPFVPFVLFVGSPVVAPRPRQNKLRILDRIVVQYVRGVPAMTRHVVTFALVTMFAASATAVLDAQRGGASMGAANMGGAAGPSTGGVRGGGPRGGGNPGPCVGPRAGGARPRCRGVSVRGAG